MKLIKTLKSRNGRVVNLKKIEPAIEKLAKRFNLYLLYIFGSYSLGNAGKLSDVDIAFLSKEKFPLNQILKLTDSLQEIFEDEAIDLIDLRRVPLTLIHRVLKEGKCLYAKSLKIKIEYETRWESLYLDTAPLREEFNKALAKRIKDGTFGHRQGKAIHTT